MKKFLIVIIALCLASTLVACGTKGADTKPHAEVDNVLIAYFSCTNNTEDIAMKIEYVTGGKLYRIVPGRPYTEADLDYTDPMSRANEEQSRSAARPTINGKVQEMEKYDVVYLGYPIWNGKAPKIIYTFLESYEFAGKTIVPFCTSGSSSITGSLPEIQALAPDATWLEGRRFGRITFIEQIKEWTDGLFEE